MKLLKIGGIIIAFVVVLFFGVGLTLSPRYEMSRSILIQTEASVPFGFVNDLNKHELWSPWFDEDPEAKVEIGGAKKGLGAWYTWEGEHSGQGKLTITESVPFSSIVTHLDFGEQGQGTGRWAFENKPNGVEATWSMEGEAPGIVGRYAGLVMDSMVGPHFEEGLKRLKEISEKMPPKPNVEDHAAPDPEAPKP